MTGPMGQGRKDAIDLEASGSEQIEYLLYQSTQGIHFIFDHSEISRILKGSTLPVEGISLDKKEKVQELLASLLERPTMGEKKSYLESLSREDYELLLRAYLQLVDKTILAHSNIRH
ncbi:MAG: hypothetical protein V4692_05755 [Bdellovibrionota bacterium]